MQKNINSKQVTIPVEETDTYVQQYVRAYIEEYQEQDNDDSKKKSYTPATPINYDKLPYLVFDTETDVQTQELRIGYAILYNPLKQKVYTIKHKKFSVATPVHVYAFYNEEMLTKQELELFKCYKFSEELKEHLPKMPITYLPVDVFITEVFYKLVFNRGYYKKDETVTCIGHNVVYDISRLATNWNEAKGDMLGGFTMRLCSCKLGTDKEGKEYPTCIKHPNIRVKKIASHKHFIKFEQRKTKAGVKPIRYDGRFINTDMLAKALLGATVNMQLKNLTTKVFDVPLPKRDTDDIDYAVALTEQFLEYSLQDVIATHYLYERLLELYKQHNLFTDAAKIFSEASLGKAYFRDLGVKPFLKNNTDFPKEVLGYGMQAYYGGRSEVNVRLQPVEIVYTDFKSQYPSGNALMNVQELLLAEHVHVEDVTQKIQNLLHTITVDDLQDKKTWLQLRVLVKLIPDNDMLPVRADFNKRRNIAINPVQSDTPVWYTLADCIASKLLLDKAPIILQALELVPSKEQYKTSTKAMFGNEKYKLDLSNFDMFTQVINLRTQVKKDLKAAKKIIKEGAGAAKEQALQDATYYDSIQLALKLLANSTSYGVLVEVVKNTLSKPHKVTVYADETFDGESKSVEQAGLYFCGPLGAFIPASGRLLLAIAQKLGMDRGLTHAFCDTDSFAFTALNKIPYAELLERVQEILNWFKALYPYEGAGELLELEDVNKDYRNEDKFYPLYCLAISTKRYVVYNKLEDGHIVIRKFTSHGTGTWSQPASYVSPANIPLPYTYAAYKDSVEYTEVEKKNIAYSSLGGRNYLYDLWYLAIEAVEAGTMFDLQSFVPNMDTVRNVLENIPAFHQFTISSYHLLSLFKTDDKLVTRPFNFITVYPKLDRVTAMIVALEHDKGETENAYVDLHNSGFYTPYTRAVDMQEQELRRLDGRGSVKILPPSLAYTLSGYFTNHENKFANGYEAGVLKRRNMKVTRLCFTGKEANSYERVMLEELDNALPDKVIEKLEHEEIYKEVEVTNIFDHVKTKDIRQYMQEIDPSLLYKCANNDVPLTHDTLDKILQAVEDMKNVQEQAVMKQCKTCKELLPVTMFRKNKAAKDGCRPSCKNCCK